MRNKSHNSPLATLSTPPPRYHFLPLNWRQLITILTFAAIVFIAATPFCFNDILKPPPTTRQLVPAADSSVAAVWLSLNSEGGTGYTVNGNHIYYNGVIVPDADPSTFLVFKDATSSTPYGTDGLAKDADHVFWPHGVVFGAQSGTSYSRSGVAIVAHADPATFMPILNTNGYFAGFAKDKYHVYVYDSGEVNILQGADPTTFMSLSTVDPYDSFYKDNYHVYSETGAVVKGADPRTFRVIFENRSRNVYGADSEHVYLGLYSGAVVVPNASPNTFEVLSDGGYVKDEGHVYTTADLSGASITIIAGADPLTFRALDDISEYAQDKDHFYKYGQITNYLGPVTPVE